jgi:hypothetical protein
MPQWTDNPIVAGATRIRAVHLAELRTAVRDAHVAAGLPPVTWTDPVINPSVPIRAVHFTQLRSAIQTLWTHAGLGPLPNWTVGSAPSPDRPISARDMNDLRAWFEIVDPPSLIGASWTNNARNWNTKSGWDVQLVYTNPTLPNSPNRYQVVGENVRLSHQAGRNVIVRIDHAEGQNLPPNASSLSAYLATLATICQNADFRNHA